jgi:hypothetical protein
MSEPAALPAALRAYLDELRSRLADLPPTERSDLLAPIELRLAESGEVDPRRVFGSPAELAADLRSAAGHEPGLPAPLAGASVTAWLRARFDSGVLAHVRGYVRSLRPAWWAARGYLLVGGALAVLGSEKHGLHTIGYYRQIFTDEPPPHPTAAWLLVPLAAMVASILLGVRTARLTAPGRLAVLALDGAAVVVLLAYPTWWLAPAFGFFGGLVG